MVERPRNPPATFYDATRPAHKSNLAAGVPPGGGAWTFVLSSLRRRDFERLYAGKRGSTLVVTKLGQDDACHVAYVEATGNPQANEQARAIADRDARSFRCKTDKAKTYGAAGN